MGTKDARRIELLDKKFVWHPFTQMGDWVREPLTIIEKGRGNYIFDIFGKKYLDGVSSLWCNLLGHSNRNIISGMKAQMSKVCHSTFLGLGHAPAARLAERLVGITPKGLSKVFFSDNGSTAVEVALKMAYQYFLQKGFKNKNKFVALKNAYHGDTIGAVSVGGVKLFHSKFNKLLFPAYKAPSPYCYRCEFGKSAGRCGFECLMALEAIFKKHNSRIAAFIVEPHIQAAGGMIVMPKGYMAGISRLCRRYGILLIADEVATGFGRSGSLFACEIEGVKPDFLCLSKGITGGYLPLAVTITTNKVFNAFLGGYSSFKTFFHGHTYTANPLACSAALAVLDELKKQRYPKRLKPKIDHLNKKLRIFRDVKHVGDIRQLGLMCGIELVKDSNTKTPFEPSTKIGIKVCKQMRERGFFLRPLGNVIVIMPPLTITNKEIDSLLDNLYEISQKLHYVARLQDFS